MDSKEIKQQKKVTKARGRAQKSKNQEVSKKNNYFKTKNRNNNFRFALSFYVSNIKSTSFWLSFLFINVVICLSLAMASFFLFGNGFFLVNIQEYQKDALYSALIIVSAIFLILSVFVIILEISPIFFEHKDFSKVKAYLGRGIKPTWGLVFWKYFFFVAIVWTFVILVDLILFIQVSLATLFTYTPETFQLCFQFLLGSLFVTFFMVLIFGSINTLCKSKVFGTSILIIIMGFTFLMIPISIITNSPVPSEQVVAINRKDSNKNEITSPTYITTYSFTNTDSKRYYFLAPFDASAAFKDFYTMYDAPSYNCENLILDTVFGSPTKANVSQDPWYNPRDYSELYPSVTDGSMFIESWETTYEGKSNTGGTPWNSAFIVAYDTQTNQIIQSKSTFTSNGWYNKSQADSFGREEQIVTPFPNTNPDDVYIVDYESYTNGESWKTYYQDDIGFKIKVLLYASLTEILWGSDTFLSESNINNVSSNPDGLYLYPDLEESDYYETTVNINNNPNDQETVYLVDGKWSNNTNLTTTNGQYVTLGDMYMAYLNDSYNPAGTAEEERIGGYSIGRTSSAPYPEQVNGMYENFFQFVGSTSSWANYQKTNETINGETFTFDWTQSLLGGDQILQAEIANTYYHNSRNKVGDWNYYKSLALYELETDATVTVPISKKEAMLLNQYLKHSVWEFALDNFITINTSNSSQSYLTLNFTYFFHSIEGLLIGSNKNKNGYLGDFLIDINLGEFAFNEFSLKNDLLKNEAAAIDFQLSYQFYEEHIEPNLEINDYYTIPAQPPINNLETIKRLRAEATGAKGVDNQSYYEVTYTKYIPTIVYFLLLSVTSAVLFYLAGITAIKQNYL